MKEIARATLGRVWMVIGLLTAGMALPLSAYQQGSFFLFDIRDNTEAANGDAGRIAMASSIFKSDATKLRTGIAKKRKKSEFEAEITDLKSDSSDSVSTGIEILDDDRDEATTESTFGDSKSASGGFFFSY